MHSQNYEDYMRTVLGYPVDRNDTYTYVPDYYNRQEPNLYQTFQTQMSNVQELEEMYPDIYRILNPMVCKICDSTNQPITRELVDKMTEEIYLAVSAEEDTVIQVNVETRRIEENPKSNEIKNNKLNPKEIVQNIDKRNVRNQNTNNFLLRDLIKIMILNQLLGGNRPGGPGRPPHGGRPPFPIRPGMPPGGRPPFPGEPRPTMPREYENYYPF